MHATVLVTATNFESTCPKAMDLLQRAGIQVIANPHQRPMTRDELSELVPKVHGVLAGVDEWSRTIFQMAPDLLIVSRFGVGVDNIDLAAASEFGIAVANCPGTNSQSVADLTFGLIIGIARQIPHLDRSTREGQWKRPVGSEVWGKTLGIVGLGQIGRLVALRAKGFDMRVIAFDPLPDREFASKNDIELVNLESLFSRADFVSLHAPVTQETRHLVNSETLRLMKRTAYLINMARGALVDERALYHALREGIIAGAALDVYENEPARQSPLFELPNIITTPHIGAETLEAIERTSLLCAEHVVRVLNGERPRYLLNSNVWEKVLNRWNRVFGDRSGEPQS